MAIAALAIITPLTSYLVVAAPTGINQASHEVTYLLSHLQWILNYQQQLLLQVTEEDNHGLRSQRQQGPRASMATDYYWFSALALCVTLGAVKAKLPYTLDTHMRQH